MTTPKTREEIDNAVLESELYRKGYADAMKKLNEIREEAVGDWKDSLGFYGFFEFIREVLERTYPLDVFENSKDIGAKITNRLWEVIKLYDEETDGAKSKQTYLSTTKEEQNHAE